MFLRVFLIILIFTIFGFLLYLKLKHLCDNRGLCLSKCVLAKVVNVWCGSWSYFQEWNVDSLMSANVDINKMGKDLKGNTSSPVFNT